MLTSLVLAAAAATTSPSASAPATALPVAPPVAATSSDEAAVVSFTTKDKFVLKGTYFPAKVSKKSKEAAPAALLIHDAHGDRGQLTEVAESLQKRGFAVLVMDLRGHGESVTDDANFEKASDDQRATMWSLASRDVDAAVDYLLDQDGVHSSNLSLVAFGSGSSLALRRATSDDNVRAVALVNPTEETYGYNIVNGLAALGGLPTLVLAPADRKDEARRLQDAAHKENKGFEYVDVKPLKSDSADVLTDKKLSSSLTTFLREQVMPKK